MGLFSVGAIGLDLQINGRNLRKQIRSEAKAASASMENAFSSSFKKIGKMAAAAFSVQAIGSFIGSSIELGSNLTEVQNVGTGGRLCQVSDGELWPQRDHSETIHGNLWCHVTVLRIC